MTLERIYNWTPLGQSQPELGLSTLPVTVDDRPQRTRNSERSEDYFANVGDAIRCLREDIPALFERELNCKFVLRSLLAIPVVRAVKA